MARTVLIADDNPKIVEVLSAYLVAEGFDVVTASDGPSAVAAVAGHVPDLALLDIMMPGIDGIELTKRFQRDHGLPVILVTARTDEIDRLIGLEVGADDYISKPFSPREVVARVKAVLRRIDAAGTRGEGGTLRIGGQQHRPGVAQGLEHCEFRDALAHRLHHGVAGEEQQGEEHRADDRADDQADVAELLDEGLVERLLGIGARLVG